MRVQSTVMDREDQYAPAKSFYYIKKNSPSLGHVVTATAEPSGGWLYHVLYHVSMLTSFSCK